MGKVILTFWLSDKLNGIRQWNGKAYYYIYTEWYTHFSGNFYTIVLRRISRMFEMNSNWQIGATKAPYWNHINNNFAIEYLLNNNVSKQDEKTNWEHSLFAVLWLRNRICNVWSDHAVMLTEFRVRIFLTHGKVLSFFSHFVLTIFNPNTNFYKLITGHLFEPITCSEWLNIKMIVLPSSLNAIVWKFFDLIHLIYISGHNGAEFFGPDLGRNFNCSHPKPNRKNQNLFRIPIKLISCRRGWNKF